MRKVAALAAQSGDAGVEPAIKLLRMAMDYDQGLLLGLGWMGKVDE